MKGRIKKRRRRRHFEKLEARNLLAYISELMVDNVSSLPDDDGDFSDWLTFGRVVGRIIRQADGDDASRFMCHVGMAAETKAGLAELLELRRFEAEAEERKAAERIKEGGGR